MLTRAIRCASTKTSPDKTTTPLFRRPAVWLGLGAGALGFAASRSLGTGSTTTTTGKKDDVKAAALDPQQFVPLRLASVSPVSHNTSIFRFDFPHADQVAGMKTASCILTMATVPSKDGASTEDVIRPYTPLSDPDQKGSLDLIVKKYPGGPMSSHIHAMKPGDSLLFKGPIMKIEYVPNKWNHIFMLAGGTGIAPMYQVINEALKNPADKTKITLLFGNISEDDILLRKELDSLAAKHPNRFAVKYTLDKPPATKWNGFAGFISKEMVSAAGLKNEPGTFVMVCGSSGMLKHVSGDKNPDRSQGDVPPTSVLGQLGFTPENVFKF